MTSKRPTFGQPKSTDTPAKVSALAPATNTTPDPEWASHIWDRGIVSHIIASSRSTIKLRAERSEDSNAIAVIRKELLAHFSPYYRAALQGKFQESKADELCVNTTAENLGHIVSWLYTGTILSKESRKRKRTESNEQDSNSRLHKTYIELYILADAYEFLALRRWSLDQLKRTVTPKPAFYPVQFKELSYDEILLAFGSLPHNSPLLNWMTMCYVWHFAPVDQTTVEDWARLTSTFVAGIMLGKAKRLLESSRAMQCPCCASGDGPCRFHEHRSDEERRALCGGDTDLWSKIEAAFLEQG